MSKIQVLDRRTSELLAAGEVVERPSSVIKELIENSLDAGATSVIAEIERGGVTFMRVTDNGSGMGREDVPTAFLRHATSKIRNESDLDGISTLGFRGEALAAVCAVSKTEVLTGNGKDMGTHYVIEGGEEVEFADAGCPKGTTMIVRDIFYNTPARMKFLKKDVTEGNSVAGVVEKLALSHPEVAFKFIRDGKTIFSTPGDGNLSSAVYSVLGREFSLAQLPVNGSMNNIDVSGFACKPAHCRANRTSQYFFINGRCFKSETVTAAVEQAYKNSAMIGRFPSCVINIRIAPTMVDVNVHPAKTEVRFADKKSVFDAVYYAVKEAITQHDIRPEMSLNRAKTAVTPSYTAKPAFEEQNAVQVQLPKDPVAVKTSIPETVVMNESGFNTYNLEKRLQQKSEVVRADVDVTAEAGVEKIVGHEGPCLTDTQKSYRAVSEPCTKLQQDETVLHEELKEIGEEEKTITYVGEVFRTYIIAEMDGEMYFIDKHAAHERILYNKIKSDSQTAVQMLLPALPVTLSNEDYDTVINNLDVLKKAGFEVEDFGGSVLVTAVPAAVVGMDIAALLEEMARNLGQKHLVWSDKIDRIYETAACRAAVKAGNINGAEELSAFAKKILSDNDIMYCPHGRPVAVKLTRSVIEKQFGRLG